MFLLFLYFKQKTAYEMRISDWSSDVCSSDLGQQTVERELLRHIAKLAFGRAGSPAQVQPHHMRLAAGGFEQAAQHLEGGRFAGAVRPEQAEEDRKSVV